MFDGSPRIAPHFRGGVGRGAARGRSLGIV